MCPFRDKAKRSLIDSVRKVSPGSYYFALYNRSSRLISGKAGERDRLFAEFLRRNDGKTCLQIGVKESVGRKYGPNWVSVDKYDNRSFIDRHDDIEQLEFDDETFDAAVCWSVLEHVPHPEQAVGELHRVLKPGGKFRCSYLSFIRTTRVLMTIGGSRRTGSGFG